MYNCIKTPQDRQIQTPYFLYLSDEKKYAFFQQDGPTTHTTNNTSVALTKIFWD
jgi:hypothetical protein